MRLPNGYGSVYKLSGKRRRPWAARKTVGWSYDSEHGTSYPEFKFIGYYRTKQDALQALLEYNKEPYDLSGKALTLGDLYDRWSAEHYKGISPSTAGNYRRAWKICAPIKNARLADLSLETYQRLVDTCGRTRQQLQKLKTLLSAMYKYGAIYELLPLSKRDIIRYIDISRIQKKKTEKREPFSAGEIATLWDNSEETTIRLILILIYTGLRAGELLALDKQDIHLDERWLDVKASKTAAGIRQVPIAEKIVPLISAQMECDNKFLIPGRTGRLEYQAFYTRWNAALAELHMKHRPHDARHTCISLLTEAEVDSRIIKQIVGHSGGNITEDVYTHIALKAKLEAINRI